VEKARSGAAACPTKEPGPAPEKFATPGVLTIDALAGPPFNVAAERQIKTLVYLADSKVVLILLRGDDQLNEAKLAGALGTANFRAAEAEEIFGALGAHAGSLGAVNVEKLPIYADERLRGAAEMTTGANEDGFHLRQVAMDRDIRGARWADLRLVRAGEPCAQCGKPLKLQRAIEVGHVFKLGTKYSEALHALFLDVSGRQQPAIMGCYGIGVTRTLQAVIEQSHDANGIIWPIGVAPYTVCITPLNPPAAGAENRVLACAEELYAGLAARGVDVILDDRDERPGVKFKDSELVGFPIRIGIGEKSLAKGEVEVKPRAAALLPVKREHALDKVMELIRAGTSA
jgi:prolyl-tRNA synthetase